MAYAWIIDTDHLADGPNDHSDAGRMGPSNAPQHLFDLLRGVELSAAFWEAEIYTWKAYDADGELYFTGRLVTDEGDTERAIFAPLDDYARTGAGCTEIRYPGRKGLNPA